MNSLERMIRSASILIASIVLILMMAQVVLDVGMRSLIGAGFPATGDIVSRYYMVALSLLPLAMTQIDHRHIEVTIITDRLGPKARHINTLFCLTLSLLTFGLLTWFTGLEAIHKTTLRAYVEAGTLIVPTWPSYWLPPLSCFLMSLVLVSQLGRNLRNFPSQQEPR